MHTLIALFDAPIPARGALRALGAAGFAAKDVQVVPALPVAAPAGDSHASPATGAPADDEAGRPGDDADADARQAAVRPRLPTEPGSLVRRLVDLDVPGGDAETCAEGVRRGAILLAVQVPTLSLRPARAALERFGAVDLAAHRARWEADPATRYGWADIEAPVVEDAAAPAAPAGG